MPSGNDEASFAGRPIKLFQIEEGITDPDAFAYKLGYEPDFADPRKMARLPDNLLADMWRAFLNDPQAGKVSALVVGVDYYTLFADPCAEYGDEVNKVQQLITAREQLPSLKAVFFGSGHQTGDDWGELGLILPDLSPFLAAYPQLEDLRLLGYPVERGRFQLGRIHSEVLRSLCIATPSMNRDILHDILQSFLPALESIELWLSEEVPESAAEFLEDLAPLFAGARFPRVRHVGLCYSRHADELASALAASPLLSQLKILDFSGGTLTDVGMQALLENPALRQLDTFILDHHFCSEGMMQRLQDLPIAVEARRASGDKLAVDSPFDLW
jgi:hypothetical protein